MLSIKQNLGVENNLKILSVPSYRLSPLVFSIQITYAQEDTHAHICMCAHTQTHTHIGKHTVSVFSGNHFPKSSPLPFPKALVCPSPPSVGKKKWLH